MTNRTRSVTHRGYYVGSTKTISCLLGVAIALATLPAHADEWWGRDKALHFTVSAGIGAASYALIAPLTSRRDVRAAAAAGTTLIIGIGKEGYDAMGHGDPSWRDLAWDVAGTAVGVMIAYAVDYIVSDPESSSRSTVPTSVASPLEIKF